jgi:hypothetical protein
MKLKKLHLPNGSTIPGNLVRSSLKRVRRSICIAALLVVHCLLTSAQVKPTPVPPAESPREKSALSELQTKSELRNKKTLAVQATDILLTVAEGSRKWDNHAAAANIQTQVADLVWDENSDVARGYLVKAWETASTVTDSQQERSPFRNESQQVQARRQVLLVARRRAPILAQKWINEMAEETKREDNTKRGTFDDRSSRSTVLLQMALASVDENPEAAAELAIESLGDGISFGLQNVLVRLQAKEFRLAETVFRAALSRLKTGMLDPSELLVLHAYLYTPGVVHSVNTSNNAGSRQIAVDRDRPNIKIAAEANPELALLFLRTSASLLINAPTPSSTSNPEYAARTQLSVINVIMEKLTQHLPEVAVALQQKAQQIATDANYLQVPAASPRNLPEPRPDESARSYAQRRVNELEETAGRTSDPLARDIAYAKAALATDTEQYQHGRNLCAKIRDDSLRDNICNWLTYRAALHFAKTNDFDQLYELNRKNNDSLQRAACLVVGAQKLVKTNEVLRARQWLTEARSLTKRIDDADADLPRVMLGIVSTYAQFDKWEALELLSESIKVMNKTPDTNYYDNDRVPLMKRFSGFGVLADFTYGTSGFSLQTALEGFPEDKFYDLIYKLNDLSSPETRGQAIVLLCRKYIDLTRQKSANNGLQR